SRRQCRNASGASWAAVSLLLAMVTAVCFLLKHRPQYRTAQDAHRGKGVSAARQSPVARYRGGTRPAASSRNRPGSRTYTTPRSRPTKPPRASRRSCLLVVWSEEIGKQTSGLQSRGHLGCRLLLEKKKGRRCSPEAR